MDVAVAGSAWRPLRSAKLLLAQQKVPEVWLLGFQSHQLIEQKAKKFLETQLEHCKALYTFFFAFLLEKIENCQRLQASNWFVWDERGQTQASAADLERWRAQDLSWWDQGTWPDKAWGWSTQFFVSEKPLDVDPFCVNLPQLEPWQLLNASKRASGRLQAAQARLAQRQASDVSSMGVGRLVLMHSYEERYDWPMFLVHSCTILFLFWRWSTAFVMSDRTRAVAGLLLINILGLQTQ